MKIFRLNALKFCSPATKDVCINRKEPPKLGSEGLRPLEVRAWLTTKNEPPPHVCYHVEFGSLMRQTLGRRHETKETKNGKRWDPAPLGWGVIDRVKQ